MIHRKLIAPQSWIMSTFRCNVLERKRADPVSMSVSNVFSTAGPGAGPGAGTGLTKKDEPLEPPSNHPKIPNHYHIHGTATCALCIPV